MAGTMTPFPTTSAALVCFGEVLLRLAAPRGELLLQSPQLQAGLAGAEANVAVALARLGHASRMVSTLPDNPLGRHARDMLRYHGVDTSPVTFLPGRMGLYFLTPGALHRPAEIVYDRAGSAFAMHPAAGHDWDKLLAGAGWLHVSGVTPAVGIDAGRAALAAARAARRLGVRVSFDGNYRASLWAARGEDGAAQLAQIAAEADLAFIDRRDIALLLRRPALASAAPQAAADAAFGAFPHLAAIAATQRVQRSVDCHELAATLATRTGVAEAPYLEMHGIVDRIGTGDAFAAGILHGLAQGWGAHDTVRFGLAAACGKHGLAGDVLAMTETQLRASIEGSFDVRR
jgi:2-dehydro-3-deoxygluconokinase